MNRKHGKYIVNTEHSENQQPTMCSGDQEAHGSACWHPPSHDVTCDVSSYLTGVCVNPGVLEHSGCPHTESSHTQVKGNWCSEWSLWNIFLACLLACVMTTAIGVLIICLVNNRRNDNSSIVIHLSPNNGKPAITVHGKTSAASQPTVTTISTKPTNRARTSESTTVLLSPEPTATIATTITSTKPTTFTHSSELTTKTVITPNPSKTTDAPTSKEPTMAIITTTAK
ncbi:dynactin-associated protein-like [Rhynchonycteris naso]